MPLPVFICRPLGGVRLTIAGCKARHEAASRPRARGAPHLESSACIGCPVGRAHAKGRPVSAWPGGAPIERADLEIAAAPAPSPRKKPVALPVVPGLLVTEREAREKRAAVVSAATKKRARKRAPGAPPAPKKPRVSHGRKWAWNGRELGFTELVQTPEAKASGVSESTIRWRMAQGWSLERALTTPRHQGKRAGTRTHAIGGQKLTVAELQRTPEAQALGLDGTLLRKRLQHGWDARRAITTPRDPVKSAGAARAHAAKAARRATA